MGSLQEIYDYGPLGVELKNNLKASWWSSMVYERDENGRRNCCRMDSYKNKYHVLGQSG